MDEPLPEHQFAKILVLGEQQCVPFIRPRKHGGVLDARFHLRHCQHFVTFLPQPRDYGPVEIFVRQQDHAAWPATG